MSPPEPIAILTTGGTIDKIYFDALSEFQVGEPQIGEVLRHAHVVFPYRVQSILRKDSLEIDDADRTAIAAAVKACPENRILVTHGTDTMVRTAMAVGQSVGKTVVFTGALIPARFRENDAIFNIGFACAAVQTLPPGVYIAINGCAYPAHTVRKNREANRFEPLPE